MTCGLWTLSCIVAGCMLLGPVSVGGVCSQIDAANCQYTYTKKAATVNCDWSQVTPAYRACLNQYIPDCDIYVQNEWNIRLDQFNKSLQNTAASSQLRCSNACPGESAQTTAVDACTSTAPGYTTLLASINGQNAGSNLTAECTQVQSIIDCMNKAVTCPVAVAYKDTKVALYSDSSAKSYCTNLLTPQTIISVPAPESYNYTTLAIVLGVVALIIGVNVVLVLVFLYDRRQRIKKKAMLATIQPPSVSRTTYYHQAPIAY